jgi:hypothetical protein
VPAPELEEHPQRGKDDGDQDVHAVGRPLRHGCCLPGVGDRTPAADPLPLLCSASPLPCLSLDGWDWD